MSLIAMQGGMLAANAPAPSGLGPVLLDAIARQFTSSTTSHQVAMPPVVDAGDLLVVLVVSQNNHATKPSGWSMGRPTWDYSRQQAFYKIATGSEDGTNVNFTTASAQSLTAFVLRYQAGTFDPNYPIDGSAESSVESTASAPMTLSPPWGEEDTHWVASVLGAWPLPDFDITGFPYPDNRVKSVAQTVDYNWQAAGLATSNHRAATETTGAFTFNYGNRIGAQLFAIRANPHLTEHTGITWSQSSSYTNATAANMRDNNNAVAFDAACTGGSTAASDSEFIQANLGSAKTVREVIVGGGYLATFGAAVSGYLNGAVLQSSTDGLAWTTRATISGVADNYLRDRLVKLPEPVTARYWRLHHTSWNYLATCTFRLFG